MLTKFKDLSIKKYKHIPWGKIKDILEIAGYDSETLQQELTLKTYDYTTLIKAGSDYVWLWVAIEPINNKMILGIRLSIERSMLVAEQFIKSLIRRYGKHNISTDGGTWYHP